MSPTITIDWSSQLDIESEHFPADQLGREKYAQFLTHFLASKGFDASRSEGEEKQNYVLNLNAEWGSGKSYFLRRWAEDLKAHYPVVYVDAWKQDYSDDPLMTVISSMIKQLRTQAGKDADDHKFKVPRKLIGLLKAAAPAVARGFATKYLGVDPVKIIQLADEDAAVGENVKDTDGKDIDMGLAASKIVEQLISTHDAKSDAIDSLKHNVEQWIQAVVGIKQAQYPAFIFIDELDRCRPSYAVEMLETIKHIFDVPGVVFVVATDTEQLQHTVKAIYGEGFDARVYLGRFFNSRYTLKAPSYADLLPVHCEVDKLSASYLIDRGINNWPDLSYPDDESGRQLKNLTTVYDAFGLSARQVIQITERLIGTVENLGKGSNINLLYLAFLLCLQEKYPHLYDLVLSKNLDTSPNDSNLHISHELSRLTLWCKASLLIQLNPQEILPSLEIPGNTISEVNNYPSANYQINLQSFISAIHPHYIDQNYSNELNNLKAIDLLKSNEKSRRVSDITKQEWDKTTQRYAPQWVTIYVGSENKKHQRSNHFYKDLVELAAALDWDAPETK